MTNNWPTFFILSNINTLHTALNPDQRFMQTVETIESVRKHALSAKIVFCDNSNEPLDAGQESILKSSVDLCLTFKNNLFTNYINTSGKNTGINELFVFQYMLDEANKEDLIGERIFKLTGRYQLQSTFDPGYYLMPHVAGKYVFTTTNWRYNDGAGDYIKTFFNTALWSMCATLVEDYKKLMSAMFEYMLTSGENLEMAHNRYIPRDKLIILPKVHGHGRMKNGEWTEF